MSNVPLVKEMFNIETFISTFAASPSDIVWTLNSFVTLVPSNCDTTQGDSALWYLSKYQPIDEDELLLALGSDTKLQLIPLIYPWLYELFKKVGNVSSTNKGTSLLDLPKFVTPKTLSK